MRDFGVNEDEVEHDKKSDPGSGVAGKRAFFPGRPSCKRLARFCGSNIDAAPLAVEIDVSFYQRKNGVVFAQSNVLSGMPLGSSLADDDVACDDSLATEFLYAKSLAAGIAAVLDGSLSFLMSHGIWGLGLQRAFSQRCR